MAYIKMKYKAMKPRKLKQELSAKLFKELKKHWEQGVRIFVDEMIRAMVSDSPGGTLDTGMTAGTLIPLAEQVRIATSIRISITSARKRPSSKPLKHMNTGKTLNGRREYSIEDGIYAGRKAFKLDYGTKEKPQFNFTFYTKTWQFKVSVEPRVNSIEKANALMIQHMKNTNFHKHIEKISRRIIGNYLREI